jgi:hypothetical protein
MGWQDTWLVGDMLLEAWLLGTWLLGTGWLKNLRSAAP